MDRDQSEVVEDSYRPSLRYFLLSKCKILKVQRGNTEGDVRHNTKKCPLELKRWPIFNLLNSEFISQIYRAMIFGDANAAVIATRDKMVYALGTNTNGRLGFESKETLYPKKIEKLCGKIIDKFVCCSQMCSALTDDGKVYFWGMNILEKTPTNPVEPFQIAELNEIFVLNIACSVKYFLFLTVEGKMCVWGEHSYTASELDFKEDRIYTWRSFAMIQDNWENSRIKQIVMFFACGANFNIAITDKNTVYSWGSNEYGQLGIGGFLAECGIPRFKNANMMKFKYSPHEIILLSHKYIVKVVCGYAHTLALSIDGKVYVWGKNNYGQLGIGCEKDMSRPNLLEMEGKILDIAAAYLGDSSAAFCSDGHIYIWGYWFGEKILTPMVTNFSNIYDVFTYKVPYMTYNFMAADEHEHACVCETLNILKCLETAFDDSETSDFIIQVEGKPIHVHKVILIMRNEYFKNMFTHSWAEKNHSVIEHAQFSYPVYKAFLHYLYTEIIKISTLENLLELLALANVHCEIKLEKHCSELIKPKITVSNVILVYKTAIQYIVKDLEECSFQFILNHTTAVFLKEFVNLDYGMQLDLTLKVAKADGFENVICVLKN